MSKSNGSKPMQRLATALRDCVDPPGRDERTAELAAALTECFDAAVERGAERAEERIDAKFGPRFDRMDATLRMIWTQCGGREDKHLPIDEGGGSP